MSQQRLSLPPISALRSASLTAQTDALDLLFVGAKGVDSAQSAAEQANLAGEGEELAALNAEYEARFPGLRYVVFVNGRGRPEIMRDMRARIDEGDYAKEVGAALQAMCDIAKDRASKLPVQEL
ncbi:hypothetical protein HIM_03736 [Hirsutella minnesotensis 3608]|uniref:Oxo-4-hydroxy-4-carboxy-5-ureidoimidazoline decarboxylase domain-containing protein n=1 Tax=Hirsutella minnesotensis 3608 TaxID=1043627 RepID=A0A0F8A6C9_9HYPO|nr:hypothetical protein HIM_03736 [Hirsutella minnesotensis 3608]